MTQSFNEKYKEINSKIKKDERLVKKIYEIAYENAFNPEGKRIGFGDERLKTYFPTKEKINNIFLGIDVQMYHCRWFPETLAKMRMLYDFSEGEADISKVYSLLFYEKDREVSHLGILSEDMSQGERYEVDEDDYLDGKYGDLLRELFGPKSLISDFRRARFKVFKKNNKLPLEIIRRPIVDLDSKVKVNKKYEEIFKEYRKYFYQNLDDFSLFLDLNNA